MWQAVKIRLLQSHEALWTHVFDRLCTCFRYRADDVTGYVADVRYEGEVKPFIPPTASVTPIVAQSLAPRPIAKRNENTLENDFEAAPEIQFKEQTQHKRHKKQQQQQQQQTPQQSPQAYYKPQPYRPF